MSQPIPVIIDTDGGVDDAVALWWALTNPAVEVVAITTVWGTVPVELAYDNVRRLLEATGWLDIPLAVGAHERVAPGPPMRSADFIHGADGLGNTWRPVPEHIIRVEEHATELLADTVLARPGEVAVIALGPLSNIATVIAEQSGWAAAVKDFVIMGGSARSGGNALPLGEANISHDPVAAAAVAAAGWATPPLMVGLDATLQATLTASDFELLGQQLTPAAAFLDEPLRFYRTFGSTFTRPDTPCHDLLAMMAVVDPEIITHAPVLPMAVDATGGPATGATVVDLRSLVFAELEGSEQPAPPGFTPWRIALEVDVDRFRREVRALFGA